MSKMTKESQPVKGLDGRERKDAQRRMAPRAAVVYEAIRREGQEELERHTAALIWSGLAAGLSMGFSFLTEALLAYHMPTVSWQPLISKFGYCIGFLIVVLGRQQLFTENTLTAVLPFMNNKRIRVLLQVTRLWITVLSANLAGALVFALLLKLMVIFEPGVGEELSQIGAKGYANGFWPTLLSGLFAGWLIALMVWLLPGAETARVTIIIIITYVIGLGGFAHIIAGSIAAIYMVIGGEATMGMFLVRFFLPALMGNIVGGVAFVTAINHAQVSPEQPTEEA
jgi:formate/nitrite transporter FocA (FNT family)